MQFLTWAISFQNCCDLGSYLQRAGSSSAQLATVALKLDPPYPQTSTHLWRQPSIRSNGVVGWQLWAMWVPVEGCVDVGRR
jgi:hypothetical protein